jgi:hypothetical protein
VPVTVESNDTNTAPAEKAKVNLNSLLFGAYAATAVLALYSLVQFVGSIVTTAVPYALGATLFVSLTAIFLSVIGTLKKMRKGARKTAAVYDTYAAIAVISVLGYFAAACVATFQPGGHATDLWTSGATAAIGWGLLFACGKYGAELFRDGGKN